MIFLTLKTDNPEAEIGLFSESGAELDYVRWQAHRELASTIHHRIEELLTSQGVTWQKIDGLICFQGPGSFTGLRIGLTVANAMAYGLEIPIVATMEEDWIKKGIERLHAGEDDRIVLPHYGAPVHITQQKK